MSAPDLTPADIDRNMALRLQQGANFATEAELARAMSPPTQPNEDERMITRYVIVGDGRLAETPLGPLVFYDDLAAIAAAGETAHGIAELLLSSIAAKDAEIHAQQLSVEVAMDHAETLRETERVLVAQLTAKDAEIARLRGEVRDALADAKDAWGECNGRRNQQEGLYAGGMCQVNGVRMRLVPSDPPNRKENTGALAADIRGFFDALEPGPYAPPWVRAREIAEHLHARGWYALPPAPRCDGETGGGA